MVYMFKSSETVVNTYECTIICQATSVHKSAIIHCNLMVITNKTKIQLLKKQYKKKYDIQTRWKCISFLGMTETHLREISLTSMKVTAVAPSLVMTTDSHHNSLRGQQRMDRSSPWPLLPNQTSPCWVRVSDVRTGHSHKSWCWHFGSHTTPYLWWRNSNTLSILITIIPVQRPKKRMKKKSVYACVT